MSKTQKLTFNLKTVLMKYKKFKKIKSNNQPNNSEQCVCLCSRRWLYPCPVAEGQHQGNDSGLQFSQSCQVIGGQTGNIVPCSHFTEQAAAEKQKFKKGNVVEATNHELNYNVCSYRFTNFLHNVCDVCASRQKSSHYCDVQYESYLLMADEINVPPGNITTEHSRNFGMEI